MLSFFVIYKISACNNKPITIINAQNSSQIKSFYRIDTITLYLHTLQGTQVIEYKILPPAIRQFWEFICKPAAHPAGQLKHKLIHLAYDV